MGDTDVTPHSDDSGIDFQISPKRVRPRGMRIHEGSEGNNNYKQAARQVSRTTSYKPSLLDDPKKLSDSLFSYTYEETTGSLLNIRLSAMQRSLMAIQDCGNGNSGEDDHMDASILNTLTNTTTFNSHKPRLSIPLDDHKRQTEEEMLEFLAVPYMDLAPEDRPFTRPPSMIRRASSMILKKNQINDPNVDVLRDETSTFCGIPTPLPHQPVKGAKGQALFTTDTVAPFNIKTLNDIACDVIGLPKQEVQSRNFLELVVPELQDWLKMKIECSSNEILKPRIRLCGDILQLFDHLVSVWVEAPDTGVLVWVIAEVPSAKEELPLQPIPSSIYNGVHRVSRPNCPNSLDRDVYLQGENCQWKPLAIGSTVVINSKTQQILSYNVASLSALLNVKGDELVLSPISDLLPQFPELWSYIAEFCMTPGIVISEHSFRRLIGVSLDSHAFISPNPSRNPDHSIIAKHKEFSVYIDLQVRVMSSDMLVLWISYSRPVTAPVRDLIPQIVAAATPPITPNRTPNRTPSRSPLGSSPNESPCSSPPGGLSVRKSQGTLTLNEEELTNSLMQIKVGARRRELKRASFRTIRMLGQGAYGEVELCYAPSQEYIVALKSINKERILVDTWSRDRELGTIPNEIKILNQLRQFHHPNIVWMVDFFEDTKCYYLEMLPCGSPNAMDLFDFIETKSMNSEPAELLNIWRQIVTGVAHIHSMGIVHRDLKDENVVINNDGIVKLIDFGSSAYVKQGPFDLFVGTVDYAAPEVVLGEFYSGIPQDVWSLGILLYTILFKEVPFKDSNDIVSTYFRNSQPSIGDPFFKLILQRDPESRPTAKHILEMLE